jgi:hypothetical protein
MIKLKDFILNEIPEKEQKIKIAKTLQPEYVFELEYENDVDFIISRKTSRTDRSLVCIVSQGQIYIKDNKTGDIELVTQNDQLTKFKSGWMPSNMVTFHKLTWKPFSVDSCWANGRYIDTVIVTQQFKNLLEEKEAYKVLANKKLDPFHNTSLVNEYRNRPDKFDETLRLIDTIKMFVPNFSIDYWGSTTILNHVRKLNLHANTVNKYKTEFDELGEKLLKLAKENCFEDIFTTYNVEFITWMKWVLYTVLYNNRLDISEYGGTFRLYDYSDYLRMQKEMYGKVKDKYPRYWLSEKQMLVNKYNDWKTLRAKIGFELNQEDMKKFEYENEVYKVVIPLMSSEIIDEAHQQQHCVASYVDRVARGDTHIVFIRKVEKPEESVLTVEINTKDEVCQVRGFMNRDYTKEEWDFMKEWADEVGLTLIIKEKTDETEV